MGQPSINISFSEVAASAVRRGERGIVALLLKDPTASVQGAFSLTRATDIPAAMSSANKEQITLALKGYVNTPSKVIGYVIPSTVQTYATVTPVYGDNPTTKGWYELDSESGNCYPSEATQAISGTDYYEFTAVEPEEGDNPYSSEWWKAGEDDAMVAVPSTETAVVAETDYYTKAAATNVTYADNPASKGWREKNGDNYDLSSDTVALTTKTYYAGTATTTNNTDYTEAYTYLATMKFNWLVVPTAETDGKTADVVSFVTAQRADNHLIKAVLPNTVADKESIVNYATANMTDGTNSYTAEQFCSRIAGIIAGTPLSMSATYAPVTEISDCTRLSRSDADAACDAGKFIALWDGEKVKMGRAVNSMTTTTATKNTQFKKIRIVEAMDMIADDIRSTIEDNYIGKFANTYDNKLLLLGAIGNYFKVLVTDQLIADYSIDIDVEANRSYLAGRGVDVDKMTDEEIRRANTGSNVFLIAKLSILDAIEDVTLPISI